MNKTENLLTPKWAMEVGATDNLGFILVPLSSKLAKGLTIREEGAPNFLGRAYGRKGGPWGKILGATPRYRQSPSLWMEVLLYMQNPEPQIITGWVSEEILELVLVLETTSPEGVETLLKLS